MGNGRRLHDAWFCRRAGDPFAGACVDATPRCRGGPVIPTFVVNLDRDSERRAALAARLNALAIPHTFLKAVDGRTLSNAELERASPLRQLAFRRPLMPSEIGCGLSHLAAIAEGARLDCDFFCVLEDDVIPAPSLPLCLSQDALAELPEFDVLRLFTHLDRWEKPSRIVADLHGSIVVRMLRPGWGCQGQIYSRRGAEKVLASMTCVRAPIDYALYHDCHVLGLKVLETRPGMVERDLAQDSTIGIRLPLEETNTAAVRVGRSLLRMRRKVRAAISFFRAWGVREFLSFLPLWR
jgi:glycosyl transferase, family 25